MSPKLLNLFLLPFPLSPVHPLSQSELASQSLQFENRTCVASFYSVKIQKSDMLFPHWFGSPVFPLTDGIFPNGRDRFFSRHLCWNNNALFSFLWTIWNFLLATWPSCIFDSFLYFISCSTWLRLMRLIIGVARILAGGGTFSKKLQ